MKGHPPRVLTIFCCLCHHFFIVRCASGHSQHTKTTKDWVPSAPPPHLCGDEQEPFATVHAVRSFVRSFVR